MTHDQALDLIPLAVLERIDGSAGSQLSDHLAQCSDCRRVYEESQLALDAVGRRVPTVAPPPSLRARVLAIAGPDAPGVAPATIVSPKPPRSQWQWALPVAATLVAALALTAWGVARARLSEAEQQVAALRQSAAETASRSASEAEARRQAEARDREGQERIQAILSAGDLRQVSLAGLPPADGARARAFLSERGLVLTAEGLPPLPPGQIYQLWIVAGQTPVSAGLFGRDATGRAQMVAPLPTTAAPAALAVTLEPAGGVPAPTGPKILLGVAGL